MPKFKFSYDVRKLPDYALVVLFGLLSDVFSLVQFRLPNNENVYSDLREIPLLIGVIYLRNPLLIAMCCVLYPITYFIGVPYFPTVVMHIVPLIIIAWFYKLINGRGVGHTHWLKWFALCIIYYFILLFPSSVITYYLFDMDKGQPFVTAYVELVSASVYEVLATTLITVLYVIQFEMNKSLEYTNQNLEKIVQDRTLELMNANKELLTLNEELTASNEEVKALNDNLEKIVEERTEQINKQLSQLSKYAHMNSHEVRAPLARILGLTSLIKSEENEEVKKQLLEKLAIASEDMDVIIRKMNRLLEQEIK